MTQKHINLNEERELLINLITSTEFCKSIIPIIKTKHLKSSFARKVYKWVKAYYDKYNSAPGAYIKSIYKRNRSTINENDNKEIKTFLSSISKQFELSEDKNIDFEITSSKDYIYLAEAETIRDGLSEAIESKDIEKVKSILEKSEITFDTNNSLYTRIGDIEIKSPDWIIDGLFEKDSTSIIFGDPGTGKSFLALTIGASIASGTDFFDHRTIIAGPVVYVCGEGHNTIGRRCKAWSIRNHIDLSDKPFYRLDATIQLLDENSLLPLVSALKKINETEGAPALIIIDTWNRLSGGDENSNSDAAKAIAALDKLRAPYNCSVLIVHHSGHGDKNRARGASALNGAVDNAFKIERKDSDSKIVMTATKIKDGREPEPMAFNLVDIDIQVKNEHNQNIYSATLELGKYVPANKSKQLRGKTQMALETLEKVIIETNNKATYKLWKTRCSELNISESTFNGNRKNLLGKKIIYLDDNNYYKINSSSLLRTTGS